MPKKKQAKKSAAAAEAAADDESKENNQETTAFSTPVPVREPRMKKGNVDAKESGYTCKKPNDEDVLLGRGRPVSVLFWKAATAKGHHCYYLTMSRLIVSSIILTAPSPFAALLPPLKDPKPSRKSAHADSGAPVPCRV